MLTVLFVVGAFASAFALSLLAERLSKRRMSPLVRGVFTLIVGLVLLQAMGMLTLATACFWGHCI